jgi:hypothetical protein
MSIPRGPDSENFNIWRAYAVDKRFIELKLKDRQPLLQFQLD